MKITLKTFAWSLFFISFCFAANAQLLPIADSLRIGIGAEAATATGIFGTGVNTPNGGTAASAYQYGTGISLRFDYPINKSFYATANAGYTVFFPTADARNGQQVISNTTIPSFQTIPLKLGVKWFTGSSFYFQGEVGETLLANKAQLYALYSYAFTWSPQLGLLLPLKKKHTYIDAGLRFESFASFYNDSAVNDFWAIHIAYMFNL
jgi:hypothetical protein